MQYRQINELFYSQQLNVQLFLLKHIPSKESVIFSSNNPYQQPNIQLTYNQLQCLTSNCLFIQFCNEINLNQIKNSMGIQQFLNKLSLCQNIHLIKQYFLSERTTRRKKLQ